MSMQLHFAGCSDTGRVRDKNQDAYLVTADKGLAVLADGMGGHRSGEIASDLAVKTVTDYMLSHIDDAADDMQTLMSLGTAVELANQVILRESLQSPELRGMGTTIVVTCFRGDRLYYAHVGDSRIYLYQDGKLTPLTKDHSLVQLMVDQGRFESVDDAVKAGVGSNMLTRGLGVEEQVEVDVSDRLIDRDAIYLLCSDGLTGMLSEQHIAEIISKNTTDLDAAVEVLIAESLHAGGFDNVTAVLLSVK